MKTRIEIIATSKEVLFEYEKEEKSSDIDWEQRRYEPAKAAMNGFVSSGWIDKMEFNTREVHVYSHTYYDMAERSLATADEMIKQLKEG